MSKLVKRFRLFIIISLVVLVAGLAMYGFLGFNNTVDYKDSYELEVSVSLNDDKAKDVLKSATSDYLTSVSLKDKAYAMQVEDNGGTLVYKFDKDVTSDVEGLKGAVDGKLTENNLTGITCETKVSMVKGREGFQMGWALLAAGIAVVIMFVYMLIMEKLSGAVATLCSSVVAYLLFVSLMGLTRLPAINTVSTMAVFAVVLASVLSASSVHAYKNQYKSASGEKMTASECVMSLSKSEGKKYHISMIVALISGLVMVALFVPYLMIIGGQIAIAGVSAIISASFMTPIVWSAVKGNKK